jgi:4-amino-4-deoxychorismate lyase
MNRSNALAAPVWRGAERVITLSARHMLPEIGRRLKALSYLTAIYSARELAAAGVREGILRTPDGVVAEGSVSNLFALANDVLYTPPLELGVLAGITRGRVIELAREQGLEVRECAFDLEFFKRSDECFYTNSLRELVPIAAVDSSTIGSGASGPITMMLLDAYRREAPDEWI